MGRRKTLTVGILRETLIELPDNLPVVIAGGKLKVVSAEVVYRAEFDAMDFCVVQEQRPTAVMLRVVAV